MTTTVYTKEDCRQCDMTIRVMDSKGINYTTENILEPANLERVKALGFMAAPVVVTDNDAWSGFRPERIHELAERAA